MIMSWSMLATSWSAVMTHWFWFLATMTVVVWYSSVTVYVAIRGALDIKHMLSRLKASQDQQPGSGAEC